MRRKRPIPESTHGINVTPLCDVMLCLLIFFMMVSRQGMNPGADKALIIPTTIQGIRIEDMGNTVMLNLYATEAGTQVVALDPDTHVQLTLPIAQAGKSPLKEFLIAKRAVNPRFKVIIRADKSLTYQYVEPVLRACAEAQVESVNLATTPEGQ